MDSYFRTGELQIHGFDNLIVCKPSMVSIFIYIALKKSLSIMQTLIIVFTFFTLTFKLAFATLAFSNFILKGVLYVSNTASYHIHFSRCIVD